MKRFSRLPKTALLLFSLTAWQCHSPDESARSDLGGAFPELSELKRERALIDSLLGQTPALPEKGRMNGAYDRSLMFDEPVMFYIDDWDLISRDSLLSIEIY